MPGKPDRRVFAPSLWFTLLAVALCALFVSLGRWQLHRAEEKRVLFAGFAAGAGSAMPLPASFEPVTRYRRVTATGRYDTTRQFLLDNMSYAGEPGYHVLTPLVLRDRRIVLVDRGFVPFGTRRRGELPRIAVGTDVRTVTGRADFLPRPAIELRDTPAGGWPRVVGFPRRTDIAAALGATVHPQLVLLDAVEPDGFLRDWQPPGMPPERHLGYAVQWFGLAVTLALIWLILSFPRRQDRT